MSRTPMPQTHKNGKAFPCVVLSGMVQVRMLLMTDLPLAKLSVYRNYNHPQLPPPIGLQP